MITIAIVEPNPIQRAGLSAILKRDSDFLIVGESQEITSVQITIEQFQPQILLIDFSRLLNTENGFDKYWYRVAKKTKTIALNSYKTKIYLYELLRLGIYGALDENISQEDLINSIRKVAKGEILFNQDQFDQAKSWNENVTKKWQTLTKRERQILKSLENGSGNKIIAQKYVISQKTVAFHVSNILQKLNVNSRQGAVFWVNKNMIINPENY